MNTVSFYETAEQMKKKSARLVAEWAAETSSCFELYACYHLEKLYQLFKLEISKQNPEFPSLSTLFKNAVRFERQILSLMGIVPKGLQDTRPWIKFEDWPAESWPLRKNTDGHQTMERQNGKPYQWIQAQGEGVYEIPVGPVHAGIIEPGHFRFQAVGETILNLEERLGYVHKGIEKRFESMDWISAVKLAARVSGDSTVAHGLAYSQALESMTDCSVPSRSLWLRALFLERERIANHLGDIGAICNDAAFSFLFVQFMRLREGFLRTNHNLWGHRFMMDLIIPGGVSADLSADGSLHIAKELSLFEKEFESLVDIYDGNPSLEERVRDTGKLSTRDAEELGVVGYVARASGLSMDCRADNPSLPYLHMEMDIPVYTAGDVNARVWVRIEEIRQSIRIIQWLLEHLPAGEINVDCPLPQARQTGFSAVEGWRGETVYWLQADENGHINRCMVRDPSAVNWLALEYLILGEIVPDFPLCNKSVNASYSGHDL